MTNKLDNPFYFNYLFGAKDLQRKKLRWYELPISILWHPMYIQLSDGYEFYFKIIGGKYYLLNTKRCKQ